MPDIDPLSLISDALDDREDDYRREWKDSVIDESLSFAGREEAERVNELKEYFRPLNRNIGAVFETIISQQYSPTLPTFQGGQPYAGELDPVRRQVGTAGAHGTRVADRVREYDAGCWRNADNDSGRRWELRP